MATYDEKSGVHVTATDAGWPVGVGADEPGQTYSGNGGDGIMIQAVAVNGETYHVNAQDAIKVAFQLDVTATSGTFRVRPIIGGSETVDIPFDCTAEQLNAAFIGTSKIHPSDLVFTGGPAGTPFNVKTEYGGYRFTDLDAPVVTKNGLMDGGNPGTVKWTKSSAAPLNNNGGDNPVPHKAKKSPKKKSKKS